MVKKMLIKSFIFAVILIPILLAIRSVLHTYDSLADVSGVGVTLSVFGTLYGIMAAFVVFEVWGQYNKTQDLIEQESQGLERLYRLVLYFRDNTLTKKMKTALETYMGIVIEGKFLNLGEGRRNVEAGKAFRKISKTIREVKFDDDHDEAVFSQVVSHFEQLSIARSMRITQSLTRLPNLLKIYLYISSLLILAILIALPFGNPFYGCLAVPSLGFVLAMILQLVEDLDNPFTGYWNLTPEPFERALKHIQEDY